MIRTIMLLFVAVFTIPNAVAQHPSKVDAPTISKGDRWAYVTIDRWKNQVSLETEGVAAEVSDSTIQWQKKDNGHVTEMRTTRELNIIESGIANGKPMLRYSPHTSDFNFPLETGKCWKETVLVDNTSAGRETRWDTSSCVLEWETVKDRSGRAHEAIKVEKKVIYQRLGPNGWSGTMKWMYWYSPKAKGPVLIEYEDTTASGTRYNYTRTELVSYEFVADAPSGNAAAGSSSTEKKK